MGVFGVEIFLLPVEFIVENDGAGCDRREGERTKKNSQRDNAKPSIARRWRRTPLRESAT